MSSGPAGPVGPVGGPPRGLNAFSRFLIGLHRDVPKQLKRSRDARYGIRHVRR